MVNSTELDKIRQQAEFIKSSENLYKEFKKLVQLVEKNSLALEEEEIQFKLIAGMVKKDCLENISPEICILAKRILKALPEPGEEQINFRGVL